MSVYIDGIKRLSIVSTHIKKSCTKMIVDNKYNCNIDAKQYHFIHQMKW